MDLAHAQAAFLFQQGRVPEQALRWALGQPRESGDDLCEVLLAAGWISEEVAADARGQPLRRETQRLAELEDNEETAPLPGEVRRLMAERERAAREAALQRVQGEDGQPGARSDLLLSESAPPEEDEAQGEDAEEELPPLGPYRLLRRLGQGGMGTVFLAEHTLLRRQVALKRIRPRAEVDAERALKRFEVEARAMARLEHEHILRILDIRVEQGAAYMIMELAEGGSLADRLEKTPQLPPDEAMALGEKLARALHHAHVHAIVHRDVKPDNVLFDGEGRPLLTDFGLAKPLDESLSISRPGSLIGTLLYMAPEQVKGEPVDARVDVYALGVTLLEILAGEPPFLRETQGEVLEAILNQPAPLGLLPEGTPRPVRTIVARCLAKRREDRYASAEALAEDCRRYLAREPILAQPVGVAERLLLWRRRHPALFALLIAFAFLTTLLPGLVELVRQRQQVAEAREEAQRQERVARALEDSLAQVQAAQRRAEQAERETRAARDALQVELGEAERLRSDLLGRTGQRQRAHRGFARARRGGRDSFALALGQLDLWRQAPAALLPLPGEGVDALALGRSSALVGRGRRIERWDLRLGERRLLPGEATRNLTCLLLEPTEAAVLSGDHAGELRRWSLRGGSEPTVLGRHEGPVQALALDLAGRRLLSAGRDGVLALWRLGEEVELRQRFRLEGLETLRFVPGSDLALIGCTDRVEVWDLARWARVHTIQAPGGVLASGAGQRAACGSAGEVTLFDPRSGRTIARLGGPELGLAELRGLAFTRRGQVLSALDAQGRVVQWSVASGEPVARFALVADGVAHAAFDALGERLLAGDGRRLRGWRLGAGAEGALVVGRPGSGAISAASAVGELFVLGRERGGLELWDPLLGLRLNWRTHESTVRALAGAPDGSGFASGGQDGSVALWRLRGDAVARLPRHVGEVSALAFSPDGLQLAVGSEGPDLDALELAEDSPLRAGLPGLPAGRLDELVLDPAGGLQVRRGSETSPARALLLRTWSSEGKSLGAWATGSVGALRWRPEGLESGGLGGVVARWSAAGERAQGERRGEEQPTPLVGALLELPGGRTLAAHGRHLVEWDLGADPPRKLQVLSDPSLSAPVQRLAAAAPGFALALYGGGEGVALWDLSRGELAGRLRWPAGRIGAPVDLLAWPERQRWLLVGRRGVQRLQLSQLAERIELEEALERWLSGGAGEAPEGLLLARLYAGAQEWAWAEQALVHLRAAQQTPLALRRAIARGSRSWVGLRAVVPQAGRSLLATLRGEACDRLDFIDDALRGAEGHMIALGSLKGAAARERAQEALSQLKRACSSAPNDPRLSFARGALQERAGELSDALESFRYGLGFDPQGGPGEESPGFLLARARLALNANHADAALADLERLDRAQVLVTGEPALEFLQLLIDTDDAAGALRRLDLLAKRGVRGVRYDALRGEALAALGRHREALAAWERVVAGEADHVAGHLGRARALRQLGRPAEALDSVRQVLRLRPTFRAQDVRRALVSVRRANERVVVRSPPYVELARRYEERPGRGRRACVTSVRVSAEGGSLSLVGVRFQGGAVEVPGYELLEAYVELARLEALVGAACEDEEQRRVLFEHGLKSVRLALQGGAHSWSDLHHDPALAPLRELPGYLELLRGAK